ncbi:MAG: ABC transporter permease [Pirellulales bacterium]|nr:ABC transporter permease [Pirellulales bacterium]
MAQVRTITPPRWRQWSAALAPWLMLLLALALLNAEEVKPRAVMRFWPAWAETGTLAVALTAIMLTGGIDLSIGSIMALAGMTLGLLWRDAHWPIAAAAVAAVLVGGLAGAINGALVVLGLPSLVVTLATMAFYAGLALAISGGERISGLPADFCELGRERIAGVPTQVCLLGAALMAGWIVVHHTRFGRYLFAIGDNRTAATFAAVPVRRLELALYLASGLVAGLVAVFYTARTGAAIPTAGQGRELEAITCVVLGGTLVTGGFGGIGRTALGIVVLAHLEIALQFADQLKITLPGSDSPWQLTGQTRLIILGMLLIAVAIWNQRARGTRA